MNITETKGYRFYEIASEINFYTTFVVIGIGLIGNLLTIYILNSKPKTSKKHIRLSYRNRAGVQFNSFSSSQCYMLALAVSDSLFLFSHFVEDTLPSMSLFSFQFMQLVNHSNVMCKLTIFVRNSARVCSSYLVVFFAYERFTVIKSPLNRLKFHNKKLTKISILVVYVFSFAINLYALFVNGVRPQENHEFRNNVELLEKAARADEPSSSIVPELSKMECDVQLELKAWYDYTVFAYVCVGIILPILLVCYFNIYITRVLLTRKNRMLRHFFPNFNTTPSTSNEIQLHDIVAVKPENSTPDKNAATINRNLNASISDNNLIIHHESPHGQTNFIEPNGLSAHQTSRHLSINSITFKQPGRFGMKSDQTKRKKSALPCFKGENSETKNVKYCQNEQCSVELILKKDNNENKSETGLEATTPCVGGKAQALVDCEVEHSKLIMLNRISSHSSMNEATLRGGGGAGGSGGQRFKSFDLSYSHRMMGSIASQYSGLTQKLKDSGRATIILVLISAFFVAFNLPYIVTWFLWFVPHKLKLFVDDEQTYFRYAFVKLAEILHIFNFSINLFLYCMASKLFRNELYSRLNLFRNFKLKFHIPDALNNNNLPNHNNDLNNNNNINHSNNNNNLFINNHNKINKNKHLPNNILKYNKYER